MFKDLLKSAIFVKELSLQNKELEDKVDSYFKTFLFTPVGTSSFHDYFGARIEAHRRIVHCT